MKFIYSSPTLLLQLRAKLLLILDLAILFYINFTIPIQLSFLDYEEKVYLFLLKVLNYENISFIKKRINIFNFLHTKVLKVLNAKIIMIYEINCYKSILALYIILLIRAL